MALARPLVFVSLCSNRWAIREQTCCPDSKPCPFFLSFRLKAGNKPYPWNVVPEHTALGVCLERMHRTFSELLVLAQRYNPVETGPRRVSTCLIKEYLLAPILFGWKWVVFSP